MSLPRIARNNVDKLPFQSPMKSSSSFSSSALSVTPTVVTRHLPNIEKTDARYWARFVENASACSHQEHDESGRHAAFFLRDLTDQPNNNDLRSRLFLSMLSDGHLHVMTTFSAIDVAYFAEARSAIATEIGRRGIAAN